MQDSPIQEIKDKLPILTVVQDFVQLKKAGSNYKGVCPFHSEKTPSFMVSPSKQIWHCFGCGLGGDIFEFIKRTENVEFNDALKILADRAGVELRKPTPEQIQYQATKDVLYEINAAASKYFVKVLWESNAGAEALTYLRGRGLSDPTINTYAGSVTYEELKDASVTMIIDQQKYFAFKVDDIDKAQMNIDAKDSQASRAGYMLREVADTFILSKYVDANTTVTGTITTANVLSKVGEVSQKLAEKNVPENDRFIIIPPWLQLKLDLDC